MYNFSGQGYGQVCISQLRHRGLGCAAERFAEPAALPPFRCEAEELAKRRSYTVVYLCRWGASLARTIYVLLLCSNTFVSLLEHIYVYLVVDSFHNFKGFLTNIILHLICSAFGFPIRWNILGSNARPRRPGPGPRRRSFCCNYSICICMVVVIYVIRIYS